MTCTICGESEPIASFCTKTNRINGREYHYTNKKCNSCLYKIDKPKRAVRRKASATPTGSVRDRIATYFKESQ